MRPSLLVCAERCVSDIVRFNNLKKSTVCDVKQWYDDFVAAGVLLEEYGSDRKVHRRRSDTLEASIIAKLQALVDQDPWQVHEVLGEH